MDENFLIHTVCQWGDVGIVRYLINKKGCNPNIQDTNLDTALHVACYNKSIQIVKLLLEKRCKTNIPNRKGEIAQDIPLNDDGDTP